MSSSQKPTSPRRRKRSSKLRIVLLSIVSTIALVLVGVFVFVVIAAVQTPKWDPIALDTQKQTSYVYDKDGVQIAQLHGVENRQTVEASLIPDLVKKTFIAVEDKRFYEHPGVDPIRIVGSALNDIRSRSTNEGASTITIQLAKNYFIQDPTAKKFTRKIQEAVLAFQLEHEYTKDEILGFYLNKIYLGESSYGIQAAAKTYFGVGIEDLKPVEVALLAGLPQAPSRYNPYFHPEAATNRRAIVLGVMRDAEIITSQEYEEWKDAPFDYVESMQKSHGGAQKTTVTNTSYKFPYFVDYVIEELKSTYSLTPDQIYSGGLRIYTTVDSKIQGAAEAAFADASNFPKEFDSTKVEGAMTVIDPSSGAIVAMVGGRDHKVGGFNRAWEAKRQPGSTIKPLVVYGPAIEKGGYFPGTVLDDMPVSYKSGSGTYSPTDFDTISKGWKGLITMRSALEDSVNVYAVKLLNLIGIDYGWKFGKDNLGLPLESRDRVLSLALGTPGLTTVDMVTAYGIYANNGVSVTDHTVVKVTDSKEIPIITPKITKNRVMKETTAYIINDMLRSVVTSGTGTSAQIGNWAVAGKTGTSSLPDNQKNKTGNTDAWFAGYTQNYAGVVWMGYDSNPDIDKNTPGPHYLRSVYGGSFPAQIWKKVMTVALQDLPVQSKFTSPSGITSGSFDTKSGLLPSSLTPPKFISTEIAAQGDFPTQVSNVWFLKDVDADHPDMLASPNSKNTLSKTFLTTGRDPSWTWPSDEAPYRPPTATAPESVSDPDLDPNLDPNLDPTTPPPVGTLPPVDPTLPSPKLGPINYNEKTFNAEVSMTVPLENKGDSTIFYLKRPGQAAIEIPIKASNSVSTSISISLGDNGKPPSPGDYVIWAAFKNRTGSGVGPSSGNVKVSITD